MYFYEALRNMKKKTDQQSRVHMGSSVLMHTACTHSQNCVMTQLH